MCCHPGQDLSCSHEAASTPTQGRPHWQSVNTEEHARCRRWRTRGGIVCGSEDPRWLDPGAREPWMTGTRGRAATSCGMEKEPVRGILLFGSRGAEGVRGKPAGVGVVRGGWWLDIRSCVASGCPGLRMSTITRSRQRETQANTSVDT